MLFILFSFYYLMKRNQDNYLTALKTVFTLKCLQPSTTVCLYLEMEMFTAIMKAPLNSGLAFRTLT